MADLLQRRTGANVAAWKARIRRQHLADEASLRSWLAEQAVTGYSQQLLVMETFGYPEFLLASADQLIEGQYADRPALRLILDVIVAHLPRLGKVTLQARKGYVSLLTPRRTFATVQPTTKRRVDLGLRLAKPKAVGRLARASSMGNSQVTARIPLSAPEEVDDEVITWLRRAYDENS
ncbi:MAG: hypothetical protein E6J01_02880 [Chloroflexi bacterium]|nr:MAG: hypothetical protein E6J01_02880 [Chloroflexota bacterium]